MKKGLRIFFILFVALLLTSCSIGQEQITLYIEDIYEDYFVGHNPTQPYKYKVYGTLEDKFCEGDYVDVKYKKKKEIDDNLFELKSSSIKTSEYKEEERDLKPVIYLYPTEQTKVSVDIDYNGTLTHTYPLYEDGWEVTAYTDGTLVNKDGKEYPYLFWEGKSDIDYDMTKGFCIAGTETEHFLREKLSYMGLNSSEIDDFVEFWLPSMQAKPYNLITFQTTQYTDNARLSVSPEPDSIIRVFMVYKPLDEFVDVEEQLINTHERKGFTLVEWGGRVKK